MSAFPVSQNAEFFGNIIAEPEPGPQPGLVLLLQYAHPAERLDEHQLRRLGALINTLIPPEE